MDNIILRLGNLKDSYLFILVLSGKMSIDEAEKIVADRKEWNKKMLQVEGKDLF